MKQSKSQSRSQSKSQSRSRQALLAVLILALPFVLLLLAETLRRTGWHGLSAPAAIRLVAEPVPLQFLGTPPPTVWHLILVLDAECGEQCIAQLQQLHGFRIALGRHSGNLRLAVLQSDLPQRQQAKLQQRFPGLTFYPPKAAGDGLNGDIGIADPNAHLIGTFAASAEPEAVLKDIRKLMR